MAEPKFKVGDVVQLNSTIFTQKTVYSRGSGTVVDLIGDNLVAVEWAVAVEWVGDKSWCLSQHLELAHSCMSLEEMLKGCLE
jgi:hypothetical protein